MSCTAQNLLNTAYSRGYAGASQRGLAEMLGASSTSYSQGAKYLTDDMGNFITDDQGNRIQVQ